MTPSELTCIKENDLENNIIPFTKNINRSLSSKEPACADKKKRRLLQIERMKLLQSQHQEIINLMKRSLEEAEAANMQHKNLLRLLDSQYGLGDKDLKQNSTPAQTSRLHSPQQRQLSLSRGHVEPEYRGLQRNSKDLCNLRKSPETLSTYNVVNNASEACFTSSLGGHISKERLDEHSIFDGLEDTSALHMLPAKTSSMLDPSRSFGLVDTTPHFGVQGSKAIRKKPFVPRLDLSKIRFQTTISNKASAEALLYPNHLQQEPPQVLCDQVGSSSRRTSRRLDSARLISTTNNHFGNNIDSTEMILSRIKRKANGASCSRGISMPVNSIKTTSSDNNESVSIEKKLLDSIAQNTLGVGHGPSPLDLLEESMMQSVPESFSAEPTCMDGAHQTLILNIQRSMSPPTTNGNLNLETSVKDDVVCFIEPTLLKEKVSNSLVNLEAQRQEKKSLILHWTITEKLSTLITLNNTISSWKGQPTTFGTSTSTKSDANNIDFILDSLIAAKESQKRLFDCLYMMQGNHQPAICCSAARELVHAYPPEILLPTSFINDYFVNQHKVNKKGISTLVDFETLNSILHPEVAKFWQALKHHVVLVANQSIATPNQSAKEFAQLLLKEMKDEDIVKNFELIKLDIQAFLEKCFMIEPLSRAHTTPPRGKETYSTNMPSLISNKTHLQDSSSLLMKEEIITNKQKNSENELTHVASKYSKKPSFSSLNSLKFWKRKPEKLEMVTDFVDKLNLNRTRDRLDYSQTNRKKVVFNSSFL